MSSLNVAGAVIAVLAAFHSGSELISRVRIRDRRRQVGEASQENLLQNSLQTAELEVGQRYAADCEELGDVVYRGDDIARDRLLHIAADIRAEIVKSLQLAIKYDNNIMHLKMLHEACVANRKDAIETLDELKQRILITMPLHRNGLTPDELPTWSSSSKSVQTIQSHILIPTPTVDKRSTVTSAVAGTQDRRSSLAKYLTMKRNGNRLSISRQRPLPPTPPITIPQRPQSIQSTASFTITKFSPALDYLLRESDADGRSRDSIMRDIDDIIGAYQELHVDTSKRDTFVFLQDASRRDTLNILNGASRPRDTVMLNREAIRLLRDLPPTPDDALPMSPQYPALNYQQFAYPNSATTYQSKTTFPPPRPEPSRSRASSVYSDAAPPSLSSYGSSEPPSPSLGATFCPDSPTVPMIPIIKEAPERSPLTQIRLVPQASYGTYNGKPILPPPAPPSLVASARNSISSASTGVSSSALSINTQGLTPTTSLQGTVVNGRPCKDNNYWGFCKGAWTIREDVYKGLETYSIPGGMYNMIQKWRCKNCHFQGETFQRSIPGKKKKDTIVDPNIHTSSVGIRYRWIFLAKSHVKKKSMDISTPNATEKEDVNYGCLICSAEGHSTGVYGNVETLMNHIFMEHAKTMSENMLLKTKCIVGREARADEEWDINFPWSEAASFI